MTLFIILAFIMIGCMLVWYLLSHDHGRKLPAGTLWIAFAFGVLSLIVTLIISSVAMPADTLIRISQDYSQGQKLLYMVAVAFIEEAAKFAPLALFIYYRSYFREHTDGVIYFAICGLCFGLVENITYTLTEGASTGLLRLVLMPFFHAASTSILGYYLINMKINRTDTARTKFIVACAVVPILHAVYNFGLISGVISFVGLSLLITALLTFGLFRYFVVANNLDKAALVAVPVNRTNFCTKCGNATATGQLFCTKCGSHI